MLCDLRRTVRAALCTWLIKAVRVVRLFSVAAGVDTLGLQQAECGQ
jgi:hypothetical protein